MRGHGIFWAQLSHWVLGESGGGGVGELDRKDKLGPDCRGHRVRILRIIVCRLGRRLQWQYGSWTVVERY